MDGIVAKPSKKEVRTFKDRLIWQRGILLVEEIYRKTEGFPKAELYGLVAQMRKAAVSIPSNIAEGYRRRYAKEFQQFLGIALGSLGELETQIILAARIRFLTHEDQNNLLGQIDSFVRMIISTVLHLILGVNGTILRTLKINWSAVLV